MRKALSAASGAVERTGLKAFVDVPRTVAAGTGVTGYPALVDEGGAVALRVLGTAQEQTAAMRAGVRRMLVLNIPVAGQGDRGFVEQRRKLALSTSPHGSVSALLADCIGLRRRRADGPRRRSGLGPGRVCAAA